MKTSKYGHWIIYGSRRGTCGICSYMFFLLFVWWLCDLPWQPMAYLFLLLTVVGIHSASVWPAGVYPQERASCNVYEAGRRGCLCGGRGKEGLEGDWY